MPGINAATHLIQLAGDVQRDPKMTKPTERADAEDTTNRRAEDFISLYSTSISKTDKLVTGHECPLLKLVRMSSQKPNPLNREFAPVDALALGQALFKGILAAPQSGSPTTQEADASVQSATHSQTNAQARFAFRAALGPKRSQRSGKGFRGLRLATVGRGLSGYWVALRSGSRSPRWCRLRSDPTACASVSAACTLTRPCAVRAPRKRSAPFAVLLRWSSKNAGGPSHGPGGYTPPTTTGVILGGAAEASPRRS